MIGRACPLCNSSRSSGIFAEGNFGTSRWNDFSFASRKVPEYIHYRLFLCRDCDLIYANPVPAPEALVKEYNEATFDSQQEAYYASQTYGRFLPEIIRGLPDLIGAIDIGTGNGAFLEKLISVGFADVIGVEPSRASIAAAKDKIRPLIKQGIFNPVDFRGQEFSLITCFQTLEHLYDPLQMCHNMYALLKESGAVLFVCHNHRSLSSKILGLKSPIIDVEHLQLFSPRSLRFLLEQSGFAEVKIKVVCNCYPLHYWIKLLPLPRKFKLSCIATLRKVKLGRLPISIPAGNMAAIGYKRKEPTVSRIHSHR